MAGLRKSQIQELHMHHFTGVEIGWLKHDIRTKPAVFDLSGEAWQTTLKKRKAWVERTIRRLVTDKGHTRSSAISEIYRKIDAFYRQTKDLSPWDFLRAEYEKIKKKDFQPAPAQAKAQARIGSMYGKAKTQR
jgi:hypothetical protein